MPQVSLHVDDATMSELRADAAREGASLSKCVATRIKSNKSKVQARCATPSGLPDGYFKSLYGSIPDETFVRPPQLDYSLDAKRQAL